MMVAITSKRIPYSAPWQFAELRKLSHMIADGMKIASWFATKASDDEFTESSVCAAISRDH